MLKQKNFPIVLNDSDGTWINNSVDALSFGRDSFAAPLGTSNFVYFGMDKGFPMVYVEMGVASTVVNGLNVEYWNGSAWVDIPGVIDDTKGFTRSGAIQWSLNPANWAAVAFEGFTKFWVRIQPDTDDMSATTTIQGMNIVFSDDQDLRGIYPQVTQYTMSGETSFILRHEAARNDIVQELRNDGHAKLAVRTGTRENLEPWDLLQYEEVRRWSTYLVLENIFSSLQSTEDGMFRQKAEEYASKAAQAKQLFYISLDTDDSGTLDETEKTDDFSQARFFRR